MYGWYRYLAVVDCCRYHVVLLFGTKNSVPSVPDLGASIRKALKGHKAMMMPKQDKTSQDADFAANLSRISEAAKGRR